MMALDVIAVLKETALKNKRAFDNCHRNENQHPEAWDFAILAGRVLNQLDPKFGLNGKRGNASDLSSDIIAYGSGRGCQVFDFLVGAGEHNGNIDKIVWNEVTASSILNGVIMTIWVDPFSVKTHAEKTGGTDPITPGPVCPDPSRHNKPDCPDPALHTKPKPQYPGDSPFGIVGLALEADYREGGQALNAGSAVWFARTIWDYVNEGLTLDASIAKHRREWRAALGLS